MKTIARLLSLLALAGCAPPIEQPPPPPPPQPCRNGEYRCYENDVQRCQDGRWSPYVRCAHGCQFGACIGECDPGRGCRGNAPGVCTEDLVWISEEPCSGATPGCLEGQCVACPAPTDDVRFVDPLGADAPGLGGGPGHCANRSVSYALAKTDGTVKVGPGLYSQQSGDYFPLLMTGSQRLECDRATIRGSGSYVTSNAAVVVTGDANAISGCTIDGDRGGYCISVRESGRALSNGHTLTGNDIGNCGGAAVAIQASNVEVRENTIHDALVGVFWYGSDIAGSVADNTFWNQREEDIKCSSPNAAVTGSGNRRGTDRARCTGCANCSF